MTALMGNILPSNATAYERQLAKQVDEILSTDVEKIRHLWNPWKCDVNLLPYLAWTLSVDIWEPTWPEERKRLVIANAIKLHRLKGTQAGIEEYLKLVDCEAKRFWVPPARGFRVPSVSREKWAEYLADGPQLRIYPFSIPRVEIRTAFRTKKKEFRNLGFREASKGKDLYGRRATYFANGSEEDVKIETIDQVGGQAVERIYISEFSTNEFRTSGFRNDGFRQETDADGSIITVRVDQSSGYGLTVTPGLKPQSVSPARVNLRHTPPIGQHFHDWNKSFRGNNFRRESDADLYVFDRIPLYSKDTMPPAVTSKWYRGDKRFGIPNFTAHIVVDVPLKRSNARGFGGRFRNGFRVPTDMTKLDNACRAVVSAKSLRDEILIDPVTHRVVKLRDRLKLGSFKLGQVVRIA